MDNNYLIGIKGAGSQETVMPLEDFLRRVRITRHAKTEAEKQKVKEFSTNYRQEKQNLLTNLRTAGFKPSQLNTLLGYLPDKIAAGKTTMREAETELKFLRETKSVAEDLQRYNSFNVNEFMSSYQEATTVPLTKTRVPDQRFKNNFTTSIPKDDSTIRGKVRRFVKKTGKGLTLGLVALIGAAGISGTLIGCKSGSTITPPPPDSTYGITIYAKSMVEGFPDLEGAVIKASDREVASGQRFEYNATNNGENIKLNMTGGHNDVLCARAPNSTYNLSQSQNGQPVFINLPSLDEDARIGSEVELVLYKIPSSMPINDVKEALSRGTAVYDHAVTFGITNEGYTAEEFKKAKAIAYNKIVNALKQVNEIYGVPGCNYDPKQVGGKQKVRLDPSAVNPVHTESGSGVMTASEIEITHVEEASVFLEELYQAMGVRHDIGTSIRDEISDNTSTLNQFGRNLMLINYFLEPNTTL